MKSGSLSHPYYDLLIFRVMKNILGGNIRFMVSGGAPLNVDIKNFITVIFNAPIFEAYGFTEAAGCCTCTAIWEREGGHVGGTLPCNRMQLRDVPEYNLSTSSNPPAGEIYLKGNSIMKGYFKNPQKTKEIIDKDGWLKVGDIGVL
jgi:long-chain acyl-CoA synthetase